MLILIMVVLNIIVARILIFIGSNLDNCDKFKIPKYDIKKPPYYRDMVRKPLSLKKSNSTHTLPPHVDPNSEESK